MLYGVAGYAELRKANARFVVCMMTFVFAAAALAAVDELEADWIAQDGVATTNGVSHESWRMEMFARREKRLAPVAAFGGRRPERRPERLHAFKIERFGGFWPRCGRKPRPVPV